MATDFTDVDRSASPAAHIGYLDLVSTVDFVQEYKRRTIAELHLRPGDRVLDLGCGTGDDVRAMAQLVAPGGLAVGVDSSEQMLMEARARSCNRAPNARFALADAHQLDFEDATFDACRADRVLQHVEHPRRAIAELVRVARSGARITVSEPDWETLIVDSDDRLRTRQILDARCDQIRHGWIGRQLIGLVSEAGLDTIEVIPSTFITRDLAVAERLYELQARAARFSADGLLRLAEVTGWQTSLRQAASANRFFCAATLFTVVAQKH